MTKEVELTSRTTKWIFISTGIIFTVFGIKQLLSADTWTSMDSLLGLLLIIVGPLLITYGMILLSPIYDLTPNIRIDEHGIFIIENMYSEKRVIAWKNVKEIMYRPFVLYFILTDNRIEIINLGSYGGNLADVKRTIREFAIGRQIKIIGG